MTELICIVCPKGCHLRIDEQNDFSVTGYGCARGVDYGKKELQNPTRVVTTTVRIAGGTHRRLPVKTEGEIPRALVKQAVALLNEITMTAPVKRGEVVLPDVLGTGIAFVATRDIPKVYSNLTF